MERPLAEAATEHLWRTLFALVVELSIRSGLVTENDLAPAGPVPLHTDEVPRAEVEEELQEQGEESANENDPIVEFAPEPRKGSCQQMFLTLLALRQKRQPLLTCLPATQCPLLRQWFLLRPLTP